MNHGAEQPYVLASYMLDDPPMWIGLSGRIETGLCKCEAHCWCEGQTPTEED